MAELQEHKLGSSHVKLPPIGKSLTESRISSGSERVGTPSRLTSDRHDISDEERIAQMRQISQSFLVNPDEGDSAAGSKTSVLELSIGNQSADKISAEEPPKDAEEKGRREHRPSHVEGQGNDISTTCSKERIEQVQKSRARDSISIWDRLKSKGSSTSAQKKSDTTEEKDKDSLLDNKGLASSDEEPGGKVKRFRTLARMIKNNLGWTKEMASEKHHDAAFVVKSGNEDDMPETLIFDVNYYRANVTHGGLTSRAKTILRKHALERTDEDLIVLREVVTRLKSFQKYSRKIQHELARVLCYDSFDDARVIIQQGHMGQSFYFIVSGKVHVQITSMSKPGESELIFSGELSEGQTFGELALLHNMKRAATIISKGDCELLRVDRQDFEDVLRNIYENEATGRLWALSWLQPFTNWSQPEIESCNNTSKLKEYLPGRIIHGNTTEVPDNIYFIVSGQCRLVRELILLRKMVGGGKYMYILPNERQVKMYKAKGNMNMIKRRRNASTDTVVVPQRHLWNIATLNKGYYFGTGENLASTSIITKTRCEILMVPRLQFTKHGKGRLLDQLCEDLNQAIPTNEALFKLYLEETKWDHFKQSIVEEVVSKKAIPNETNFLDVPQSIKDDSWRSSFKDDWKFHSFA